MYTVPPKVEVPLDVIFFISKSPLAVILPDDDISPKALTPKLPNEADVAWINPLALILPFNFKEPVM